MFLCILFSATRKWRESVVFGGVALLNLLPIANHVFQESGRIGPSHSAYKIMLANVNTEHGNPTKVAEAIRHLDPDILVLEEVSLEWLQSLNASLKDYPHFCSEPRDDNFGIAVYSKHPLLKEEVLHLGDSEVPTIVAVIDLPIKPLNLVATHPLPPAGPEGSRSRNRQLEELAKLVAAFETPTLLAGDLNTTPWSHYFRQLLKNSRLEDSSIGSLSSGTWPVFFQPLLIPIDHVLHSRDVRVVSRSLGPNVGSDHYPLIVEFVLEKSPGDI